MSAATAASVVGIAAGVNSLTGGGITNALGMGGSSGGGGGGQGQFDPYGQYRGQAAQQLNSLMNNPSQALSQPGYQQTLQQGQQTVNRGMAATGQLQSGQEQAALQNLGQQTFGAYYNQQLANLMQLSGASQSPASAGFAQQQAASAAQNRQLQGAGTLMSGLSTLGGLYTNTGNQTSAQNIAGYASSGAGYQQSFGSDTQFGEGSYYGGPV